MRRSRGTTTTTTTTCVVLLPQIFLLVVTTMFGSISRGEDPSNLILKGPYQTYSSPQKGKTEGVPFGPKMNVFHSYTETCYNANNLFLNTYVKKTKTGDIRSRSFRHTGPWDETRICVELLKADVLNDPLGTSATPTCTCYSAENMGPSGRCEDVLKIQAGDKGCDVYCGRSVYKSLPTCTAEKEKPTWQLFLEACEKTLGTICRKQCATMAQMYAVRDYRAWPPQWAQRRSAVTLDDCVACLSASDCAQRPITFGAEGVPDIDGMPWGREIQGELIPKKIPLL